MTMKRGFLAVAILIGLGFWGSARAADSTPDGTVRDAYAVTLQSSGTGKAPPWRPPHRDRLMSKRLAALFARDDKYLEESGDIGNLDSDPFISGQDGEVKNLKVSVQDQKADRATVYADFFSFKLPVRVTFKMIRENGRWLIDDIVNRIDKKDYAVSDLLSQPYSCGSFMNKSCKR